MGTPHSQPLPAEQLCLIAAEAAKRRRTQRQRRGRRPGQYVTREDRVRDILEVLTRHEWPSARPPWLVNPKTGKRMEIDCFCEALKTGVEVDGAQHFAYSQHMHKSRDAYRRQQARDHMKDQLCAALGYTLIRVPPRSQLDDSQLAWFLAKQLGRRI